MAKCTKCIHKAVCKTAESRDGYVSGCEHFKEGWISVTERLPEDYQRVLVCGAYKVRAVGRVMNGRWVVSWNNDEVKGVTHWMPLPKPPKGE